MNLDYFGDVVLYKGTEWDSKLVGLFTGSEYTHSAMRISKKHATSITWRGKSEHDLEDLTIPFDIFVHKEITQKRRKEMFEINPLITEEYSLKSIFNLAGRILTFRPQNNKDILKEGIHCSARLGVLYNHVGLEVLTGVHYSQLTPRDFYISSNFEVCKE